MTVRIFSEYFETLKANAIYDKQQELLSKLKKRNLDQEYNQSFVDKGESIHIVDIKLAEDGSIRTYLKGQEEPIRIYAEAEMLRMISFYKRLLPLILENLANQSWFDKIITLWAIKSNLNILDRWFELLFQNHAILKDEHYSQPTKEVLRVLRELLPINIVYAIVLVIEYDTAYRYRFQDIIVHYDRSKDITKEIVRLLDLLISREEERYKSQMGNKWKRIRTFVKIALFLKPKLKKQIKEVMDNIDLDEVKMSKEDIYWTNRHGWYNYGGKTKEERIEDIHLKR